MIYNLMKRKIERDGLTEQCKNLLDVYLYANRIALEEYEELLNIGNGE